MTTTELPLVPHWIDGAPYPSAGGRTADVYDPALGIVTKRVALADATEIAAAIASARKAQEQWAELSLARRQSVLFRFRELLEARKPELAEIITAEHGKVLSDALGEISRGQEVVEFACGLAHHLKGEFSEQVSAGVDVHSVRQPLGVVGVISPFNFPAMVPAWFFPIAIAAGNAVVLKPSEKDPSAAIWMAELWREAGLPGGVFTVLNGDKEAVDGLLAHPDVAAISFVGSTPIAKYVYETGAKYGKRVQALGGAKNHMLVLPDADLDLTADAAINAGFGSAGERCMAISVAVVVEPVADALVEKITERMSALRIGDGRRGCDMGPLVTRTHRDKVASYLDIAAEDGATIVVDGRSVRPDGAPEGFWLGPSLIDRVPTGSRVYTEEIFGPVLAVVRVNSYEEGVELINAGSFGNGTAIFTNDGGAARRFQREIKVGMIGVNVPIPVPVATFSFGGWKESMFGDTKAHGAEGVKFFTALKAVTTRWTDPGERATVAASAQGGGINLGFPQND
ncbi:methylmalonate-semialdehyde dehydrogenase (CoA acylating) OS=Tsukamurella paurometabola (strain ATCC 8368 / DSM / CCUG 35730 / CIP 100753 / JCM 10117 /KCTC 9821 / NBRC 16120 / NCIMB 702349 / NCTC 13040) OX=521096 GN=Tpau_1367 PE=4 SV=1 [Tsukamurella paurometabola]|uniref:methylmalonate-semialdehyde dehydrogenase (CoA acylating) n=1 Tax=Tsukamurella paurometabola (strain ATCC 8368 / DSM 20162 / CCUG 35730 / CIP 100753 / JCM 10117 / KCTC 9821 / NBRC 16120 / NCIMB 702349 / NCTC 13040) TaxID=521096 RepID=D5UWX3_TSUPD|nr:CoA-acylating methylmalonate-semialdehyde dehydrogenase [Tsukamurella paurometabola]ADG77995.1 methylmalonate-semialdehyde dehydrogenase [Tsukamurella paurometabola DSM 20162]SUP29704.1 Methylmalonate-semialdehyde dehydrogenase [acylating] [Tsukamurella paurometabola]